MVMFASCRIYIFMKININIRIKRKIAENEWGIPTNITNILAANWPRVANNILNLSLCIADLPSGKI